MSFRADDRLNVIKYYGGKAKMVQSVVDRLDYDNATVYLEIFGGGASVLLNKPKHKIEVYNEINFGVYTLFSVLSNYEKGMELRERLKEVEYTEETFYKALEYKNAFEDDAIKENKRKLRLFISAIEKKYQLELYEIYKRHYINYCKKNCEKYGTQQCKKVCKDKKRIDKVINKTLSKIELTLEEKKIAEKLLKEYQKIEDGTLKGKDRPQYKEIEVAKATFIVQNMSRDGVGKQFGKLSDGNSTFQTKVINLIDVIERLRDVIIINENARNLLDREYLNSVLLKKSVDISNIPNWQLMYYIDAPYLEDISVTLAKRESGVAEGNPGKIYKGGGFSILEHNLLLNEIRECDANMLVSNYRDINFVYDTFLTKKDGWTYTEYPSKTNISGTGEDRTEVLWQNY